MGLSFRISNKFPSYTDSPSPGTTLYSSADVDCKRPPERGLELSAFSVVGPHLSLRLTVDAQQILTELT